MRMQIGVGALVFAVALATGCGKQDEAGMGGTASKSELATITVRKLVNEAYPQWAMKPSNNGKCPTLTELTEYMNSSNATDPWGHEYVVMCGASLPAGAVGIAILSTGADGKQGTRDDVKSWE